jgi:hypothetical protein
MASTSAAARSTLRRCAVTVRSCSSSSATCVDGASAVRRPGMGMRRWEAVRAHLPAWRGGRRAPWRRGRRSARRGGARGGNRWSSPSSRPPPLPNPRARTRSGISRSPNRRSRARASSPGRHTHSHRGQVASNDPKRSDAMPLWGCLDPGHHLPRHTCGCHRESWSLFGLQRHSVWRANPPPPNFRRGELRRRANSPYNFTAFSSTSLPFKKICHCNYNCAHV